MNIDPISLDIEKLKRPQNEKLISVLEDALNVGLDSDQLNIAVGYIRGFFELLYISEIEKDYSSRVLQKIHKTTLKQSMVHTDVPK
jgi:hypothetical protein